MTTTDYTAHAVTGQKLCVREGSPGNTLLPHNRFQ